VAFNGVQRAHDIQQEIVARELCRQSSSECIQRSLAELMTLSEHRT
jgi:hypothetical protein